MNRLLTAKLLLSAVVSTALFGCAAPTVRVAPPPTPQQLEQDRQAQIRTIATPVQGVFPMILNALMDNGFIVRSANEKIGLVSFYQQWIDKDQRNANMYMEGTLLFQPAGPKLTQVRVALTGSWQVLLPGGVDTSSSMINAVQQSPGAEQYAMVLDIVERGLTSGSNAGPAVRSNNDSTKK